MIGRLHSITMIESNPGPKTWVEAMYKASNPSHKDWWNAPQRPLPEGCVVIALTNADLVDLEPIARAVEALGITIVEATEAAALLTSTLPSQEIAPAKISDALFSAQDITAKLPARRKPKHRGPKPHGRWWDR